MLPSFSKIVSYRRTENVRYMHAKAKAASPWMATIGSHRIWEGSKSSLQRPTGKIDETEMQTISGAVEIGRLVIADFDEHVVQGLLDDMAEQMARGFSELLQATMMKVTAETGNIVDGQGRGFDADLLLETLEKMDHSFTDEGYWEPPIMIVGPEAFENFKALEETGATRKRLEELLLRKRDEHFSREASRVLVG